MQPLYPDSTWPRCCAVGGETQRADPRACANACLTCCGYQGTGVSYQGYPGANQPGAVATPGAPGAPHP